MICRVHHSHGNRLIDTFKVVADAMPSESLGQRKLFGALTDLGHCSNGFDRVLADRGFARQHYSIGAVHNRVRHIGHLGTCRNRVLNHRLHHLGRGDYDLAALARFSNQVLLNARQLRVAHLDAEIAARDHDDVSGIDNGVDIIDCLGALDLGDDQAVTTGLLIQLPSFFYVLARTHERHGKKIGL